MSEAAPVRDPREPRFPVIVKHPTFDDVKANFDAGDYTRWLASAPFPSPLATSSLHRHVAVPSMVVTGVLGSLGGFLWAFQNSSFRLQGYKANPVEVQQYITSKQE
ncbi:NADH-ubiquinone oxidoreductase, 21kDa subunit, N-terminal [Phytophthora cactorum]|nr:NADH-ubiquinone oxidoreductase, 21kDa subunit, N-terminal [Phytophthora cactorum]